MKSSVDTGFLEIHRESERKKSCTKMSLVPFIDRPLSISRYEPLRPWRYWDLASRVDWSQVSGIEWDKSCTKYGFRVSLDVRHFESYEISVKTVGNAVIVEAKHANRRIVGNEYISREFVKRYDLPDYLNADEVASTLWDGVLTIKVPPRRWYEKKKVHHVRIQELL